MRRKRHPEKVNASSLRGWRDEFVSALNAEKGPNLSAMEQEMYVRGFIRGWSELGETLHYHKRIKRIID